IRIRYIARAPTAWIGLHESLPRARIISADYSKRRNRPRAALPCARTDRGRGPMDKLSVYAESEKEALRYKWIESEKAGRDLGDLAIRKWVQQHWWGYLRARWLEHLQGKRFWVE